MTSNATSIQNVSDALLTSTQRIAARGQVSKFELGRRLREDDRGEGVISTAIAVLIIAFIGAAMWLAFNQIWESLRDKTQAEINKIGG